MAETEEEIGLQKSIYLDSYYEFFLDAFTNSMDQYTEYVDNWHVKYLCDLLQNEVERIAEGRKKTGDIIINIPPRSLKSLICTVALNAWAWAKYPWMKFISASYAAALSITLTKKTRDLMTSDWYQKYFGKSFGFSKDQDTKSYFQNTEGGFRRSTSTDSTITGDGSDIIIADDLINPMDANSVVKNAKCNDWYSGTLYNRLNNPKIGVRIIVMQRVGATDLTAYLLDKGGCRHIKIPSEETVPIPFEFFDYYEDGLFFKKRFDDEVLADLRNTMSTRDYACQYLQTPLTQDGLIFKESYFPLLSVIPDSFRSIYQSWDTAFKTKEENSRSVCITFAHMNDGKFLILDVFKGWFEFAVVKDWAKKLYAIHKPDKVYIEDKASGQSLIQELRRETLIPIEPIKVSTDKVAKAWSASGFVENGYILMPEDAPWKKEFIDELISFPELTHDDQVDALTNFIVHKVREESIEEDYFLL